MIRQNRLWMIYRNKFHAFFYFFHMDIWIRCTFPISDCFVSARPGIGQRRVWVDVGGGLLSPRSIRKRSVRADALSKSRAPITAASVPRAVRVTGARLTKGEMFLLGILLSIISRGMTGFPLSSTHFTSLLSVFLFCHSSLSLIEVTLWQHFLPTAYMSIKLMV